MNPQRWQQISRIFNHAISLDGAARSAYVKEKCGADDDLKAEVERLIESHQSAENRDFIGGLAVEDLAEQFTEGEEKHALHKGQQFGSYLILDHLGSGGMGDVYLANDSRLDRTVALKILAADVSADQRRMQRFRQEAKVASSLNQPNILTIYEFGEVDGLTYIAAEVVDGETLRDYLRNNRLKLSEILDISIQILAALDAAHEATIVHRDMKPENVMIRRRDRVVKVLDFGLAKFIKKKRPSPGNLSSDEEAITQFKTAPGLIMGTVNYMSPEQAQAKPIDARSDIWSTGVMLYEMVTGTKPFGGSTAAHTIIEILEKNPTPLTHAGGPELPAELQRIVGKSIAKDPNERYQTAKDMLIDLRNLKKRLELDVEIERSSASRHAATGSVQAETVEQSRATHRDTREISKRKLGLGLALLVAVVAVIFGVNVVRNMQSTPAIQPASNATLPVPPAVERTVTYWITVQKFRDDKPYQDPFYLKGEINFEANYRIRLNVRSDRPGYLYVLNEGPTDRTNELQYVTLFPSWTANSGSEVLPADRTVLIPEKSWFRFDDEQGVETVWLIFSEQLIPELDGIKAFASDRSKGLITDATLNHSVNGFLISHSADKVTVERGEKHTILKTTQNVLVYPIRLEHH